MRRTTRLVAALVTAACLLAACGAGDAAEPGPMGVGRGVYGSLCHTCHGSRGQGGTGPALAEVHLDFPTCAEQIEWIHLGSNKWREAHGDMYGARDKPIQGGMPSMEETFSGEEIAAVALFERVEYGGRPLEATAADCEVELPPPATG